MDFNSTIAPSLAVTKTRNQKHLDFLIEMIASALTTYFTPTLIVLGVIGNALSVFVFYTSKLRIQSTSLYLSFLAISDSVFLIQLLPPWLNAIGITNLFHRRGFCQVIVYLFYSSCCLSAWLIVSFTVERFVAVLYPLRRNSMCTLARAKSVIGLLLFFALIINVPMIKYAANTSNDCNIDLDYVVYAERFNVVDTIVSFSLPLVIVVVLNIQITCGVWRRERQQRAAITAQAVCPELGAERMQRALPPLRSQHRVTRMLLIVSTVYVVLNLPAYTMRLLAYAYDMSSSPYSGRWAAVNEIALAFFNTNFGINFILYCLTGQNFRRELCRSIPWLRNLINRANRTDDIPLVSRNAGRAGSVSATTMNPSDANPPAAVDPAAQRRERRQRRNSSQPFLEVWTFNNPRSRSAQALASGQSNVLVHPQPHAYEEIEMQDLAPAMSGRAGALPAHAPAQEMPAPAAPRPGSAAAMPAAGPEMPAPVPGVSDPGTRI